MPDLARAKRIQQQAAEIMAANESALRKDYYKLLGLDRGGRLTEGEIRRAWKEMMLKYQPDKVGNSERVRLIIGDIQAVPYLLQILRLTISQAYETLRDPEKRNEYDNGFERARRNSFDIVMTT